MLLLKKSLSKIAEALNTHVLSPNPTIKMLCGMHVIQCSPIKATKERCQYDLVNTYGLYINTLEYTELLDGLIFDRAYPSKKFLARMCKILASVWKVLAYFTRSCKCILITRYLDIIMSCKFCSILQKSCNKRTIFLQRLICKILTRILQDYWQDSIQEACKFVQDFFTGMEVRHSLLFYGLLLVVVLHIFNLFDKIIVLG